MTIKIIIIALLILIVFNLGRGLFFLLTSGPDKDPNQVAKALTWRVGLSLGLVILLLIALALGWISPHGV